MHVGEELFVVLEEEAARRVRVDRRTCLSAHLTSLSPKAHSMTVVIERETLTESMTVVIENALP